MKQVVSFLRRLRDEEHGHAEAGVPGLVAAIGALALACGSANDIEWVTWLGGGLLAVGIIGAAVVRHRTIDYEVFDRLDKLEKP